MLAQLGSLLFAAMAIWQGATMMFREAIEGSGIDYVNVSGEPEKRTILSTLASGIGLVDYDEDGDLDIYFTNGAQLVDGKVREATGDRLYRNDGGWTFTDVTEAAGVVGGGWGAGVAVGDYDNDGHSDLYVTRIGANRLYRNRGDGSFEEVGARTGVADPSWGTSAAFFDVEGDGDLDLYVANYVQVDLESLPRPGEESRCQWFGLDVMCGPKGLTGTPDVFFLNKGDGTFIDATEPAGLKDPTGAYALGVVAGDVDDDGDADLYVANDSVPNFLYRNDGTGHFTEVAFLSGVALSTEGVAQAGMGVDLGNLDGDGTLDLFVTNFSHETNNAYMNHGAGIFLDAVGEANLHAPTWFSLGWGVRLVDFDEDGDLDVFVANGHVYPGVGETNLRTLYHQPNQIFWNDGAGKFHEVAFDDGDAMRRVAASRAAAFGDLDEDGDVDGVVMNIDQAPSLLDNQLGGDGHSVVFRLVGRSSARDGTGARLILETGGERRIFEAHSAGSFLSASDSRVHVGTKRAARLDTLVIRWPDGTQETFGPFDSGRRITIVQGSGTPV